MRLRTIVYFLRQTFISLRRNIWMSILSVISVAIALFIFGAFLLVVANADLITSELESGVRVAAFMDVTASQEEVFAAGKTLKALEGVAEVELITKEEGLKTLSKKFGGDHRLISALGGTNPLPDCFIVRAKNPEEVADVADSIAAINGVEKIEYGRGEVEKIFKLVDWVKWIGWGAMILLTFTAVYLIAVTIRLTVHNRRREIRVMKYVGATDWFIRWPFFLEGILLGFIGALVALTALYFGYISLIENLSMALSFIPFVTNTEFLGRVLLWLLLAGTIVGSLGSLVSVQRYLKV